MRLDKATELAIKTVLVMEKDKIYRVEDLSKEIGTTYSFLAQIIVKLRNNGMLSAIRGPNGGYVRYKDPTVKQVIEAIKKDNGHNQLEEILLNKFNYPVSELGSLCQ